MATAIRKADAPTVETSGRASSQTARKPAVNPRKSGAKKKTAEKAQPTTKAESILALLHDPNGAKISDLMNATGWQAHSVRGFLSGTVKKKLGLNVVSERTDGAERRYRIADDTAA